MNRVNVFSIISQVEEVPDIDWNETQLSAEVGRKFYNSASVLFDIDPALSEAKAKYNEEGYAVIDLNGIGQVNEHELKVSLACLISGIGKPFGALKKMGFWGELSVKQDARSGRAHSIGDIPLHFDFDQASQPPDGLALFCVRADPFGGGANTIINYQDFLNTLSVNELELLKEIQLNYSVLYDVDGVGAEFNPHPLLESLQDGSFLFRYNERVNIERTAETASLFEKLDDFIKNNTSEVLLEKGSLLLVNQRKVVHGRRSLVSFESQARPPQSEDRLLWQSYLRHYE